MSDTVKIGKLEPGTAFRIPGHGTKGVVMDHTDAGVHVFVGLWFDRQRWSSVYLPEQKVEPIPFDTLPKHVIEAVDPAA